jgi:anion-transporting  ArsA/GET3 family ATPase
VIWFITGKGGVGKSWVTQQLHKEHPDFEKVYPAAELRPQLYEDFLVETLKVKKIAHWVAQSSLFQALLPLAPHLYEILLLHHWITKAKRNSLLVDAPSTGFFLAYFRAVKTARTLFDGGTLKIKADEIEAALQSPDFCRVSTVCLPENSSLAETQEILDYLHHEYPHVKTDSILNRVHRAPMESSALPDQWRKFGLERVAAENNRVASKQFSYRFEEAV